MSTRAETEKKLAYGVGIASLRVAGRRKERVEGVMMTASGDDWE